MLDNNKTAQPALLQVKSISKKFGEFPAESFKEWAKRARFFSNRGFSNDLIREVLHYSD